MIIGSVREFEQSFGRIDNCTNMSSEIIWESICKCS